MNFSRIVIVVVDDEYSCASLSCSSFSTSVCVDVDSLVNVYSIDGPVPLFSIGELGVVVASFSVGDRDFVRYLKPGFMRKCVCIFDVSKVFAHDVVVAPVSPACSSFKVICDFLLEDVLSVVGIVKIVPLEPLEFVQYFISVIERRNACFKMQEVSWAGAIQSFDASHGFILHSLEVLHSSCTCPIQPARDGIFDYWADKSYIELFESSRVFSPFFVC